VTVSGAVNEILAPDRDRRGVSLLWSAALVAGLGAFLLALFRLPSPADQWPMPDLDVYAKGATLLLEGSDPYGRPLGIGQLPYTYPPFSLIAFLPLALFSPGVQAVAILNTLLLGVVIWAVLRSYPRKGCVRFLGITSGQALLGAAILVSAQLLQPVASNIALGQVNVVLMTLVVVDLLVVTPRWRGLLTGVAAMVKLTPLVFLLYPIWLRDRRTLSNSIIAIAGCLILSFATLPGITTDYFAGGMLDQNLPGSTYPGVVFNQSLRGFALRVLGPGPLETTPAGVTTKAEVLWISMSALVLALLYLALRGLDRVEDRALAIGYVATAGLLASPVSWTHHWVWAVPLAAAVASSVRRFPLVGLAIAVMTASMIGEPWFLRHWYDAGNFTSQVGALILNPYLWSGLLVLIAGAWYGLRSEGEAND
jgi:alpha-1,2-mannosyltransferase